MHRIFVYGTLKKNFHNHSLLKDSEFLGPAKTKLEEYTMVSLGEFPGIVLSGSTSISGEVYLIDDTVFKKLDYLEGYPDFYNRKRIIVKGKSDLEMSVWIYYLDKSFLDNPVISDGIWHT